MTLNKFVFLVGNDGVGKTTLRNTFKMDGYTILSRDDVRTPEYLEQLAKDHNLDVKEIINTIKFFDKETLEYTFCRERPKLPILNNIQLFWFILDCSIETSDKRINSRDQEKEIWDTIKSISYFRQRFFELGAYYGVPVISTDCDISETMNMMKSYLKNNEKIYNVSISYGLQNLTCVPKIFPNNLYYIDNQFDKETTIAIQMFLEMIWRNNMNGCEHDYICITDKMILSIRPDPTVKVTPKMVLIKDAYEKRIGLDGDMIKYFMENKFHETEMLDPTIEFYLK